MTAMRKFWRLSSAERGLLISAAILLAEIRAALWLLPWRRVSGMRRWPCMSRPSRFAVERLEWAVRNSSRMVPGATCLTQALALQYLLARASYASSIHIGVAKKPDRGFEAHAWVEHAGATLLNSAGEVAHYSRLLTVETPTT